MTFNICDRVGKVRTDFSDEELASLDETKLETLALVVHAATEAEQAEDDNRASEAHITACARALGEAEKAFRDSLPVTDHVTELRRVIEQQRRLAFNLPPLEPIGQEGDPALEAEVKEAHSALEAARAASYEAKNNLRHKRGLLADALNLWQRSHAETPDQHIRSHLARQQSFYEKIARGEVETIDQVEHVPSQLDRALGSGRSIGTLSVNAGFGRRHSQRGTIRKLPSQR
jgi:hypothetical protein